MKKFAVSEAVTGEEIRAIRKQLVLTQADFARLVNVTVKTIERWESSEKPVTGPIVTLMKVLSMDMELAEKLEIPEKKYPMRLYYVHKNELCTVIDVDIRIEKLAVYNYRSSYGYKKNTGENGGGSVLDTN